MAAFARLSSILRSVLILSIVRATFRIGSMLAPQATLLRACRLYCTPFAGARARARELPYGDARCEELEVNGSRIITYAWGDPALQPYVLFAHGWSSYGTRFLPWIEHLQGAGYAVVSFDQVGHGRSGGIRATLPDFVRVISAVIARFGSAAVLVGHSLGGAAVTVAMANGLSVERAILISPLADLAAATQRFTRFVGLPESFCRRLIDLFEATGVPIGELQAHRNAPRIAIPVLIVHDLEDREIPWSEGERYARYWSDSRLLSTRGLGHNRIIENESVISAGLRFLRGEAVGERVVSSPDLPYGLA